MEKGCAGFMNGRYYSLNEYLQNVFGEKVYKLSLDAGLVCPNRDGTLDPRGCVFCHNGSSHFAESGTNIIEQIENAKRRVGDKTKAKKFIAYFQSYTNTYAPIKTLEQLFLQAINHHDIAAISIATRPDCISTDTFDLLERLNKIKPVWVELGLQTVNENSVKYIRRGYDNSVYFNCVRELKRRGITVIAHIIIGLPNENRGDALNSVNYAVKAGTDGVKLQLLHILRDTDLYDDYINGFVKPLSLTEYADILFACIESLPPYIVVHRITGDPPKSLLVEPKWSGNKKMVLNFINHEMTRRNIIQGKNLKEV